MTNVTIKDIARASGVSYATVSRTLNGRSGVDPQTRERVLSAAERLGYSPNLRARSLKTRQTRTIGLILPDISNPFFADIASAVNEVIYSEGYNSILCSTGWDAKIEEQQLSLLLDQRIDGIIFKPSAEIVDRYTDLPIAKVMISNAQDKRFNFVEIDNVKGGRIAADHLIDCGYRNLAFIGGAESSRSNQDRLKGFREQLAERGFQLEAHRIRFGNYSILAGYRAVESLEADGKEIDGYFCGNDLIALGALQYLSEHQRKVPEQVGVIGFDDVYLASLPQIQLTSVRQDRQQIGSLSARALIQAIENENPDPTTQIILEPDLIVRHTTNVSNHQAITWEICHEPTV